MPSSQQRARLVRVPSSQSVGATDVVILKTNPKRRAVYIGAPIPTDTGFVSDSTLTSGADTSATGVKSTYTVPAGVQATLTGATMDETTGTTVVAGLEIKRGATTIVLGRYTKVGIWSAPLALQAGDIVQWDVLTAVALSVTDFTIFVSRERVPVRLTIQFGDAAVAEQGLTLSAGLAPLYLDVNGIGEALQEEIHAVTNAATVTVPVLDIFEG